MPSNAVHLKCIHLFLLLQLKNCMLTTVLKISKIIESSLHKHKPRKQNQNTKYFQHLFWYFSKYILKRPPEECKNMFVCFLDFSEWNRRAVQLSGRRCFLFSPCCVWWRGMRGSSPLLQYCSSRLVLSYRLPHEATRSDILSSFCYLFCFSNSHSSALSSFHLSPSLLTPLPLSVSSYKHAHTHTHTHFYLPRLSGYSRSCLTVTVKCTLWDKQHFLCVLSK